MLTLPFDGKEPRLGARVYVAPNATLIGDLELGDDASIWFGTVIRADVNYIRIGARSNVQDNCVIHVNHDDRPTVIGDDVTIGHAAIVHGCTIGNGALIGMGARVLDGAVVGESALIGAGALVAEGMEIPPRVLAVGVPAKVKRPLTDDELARLAQSSKNYVAYKDKYLG